MSSPPALRILRPGAAVVAALGCTLLLLLGLACPVKAFTRAPALTPAGLRQYRQRTEPLSSPLSPLQRQQPQAPFVLGPCDTRRMALWWPFGDLFGGSSGSSGAALKKKNVTETREVVIIGAGVAGLVCAKELAAAGKDVLVLEAADRVGGRVQTDECDGFRLDRGFQVFIEAYPAVKRQLDYAGLDLQPFWAGALVRAERGFHTVADPFRRPQDLLKGLLAPVGSLGDKLKVGLMRFTIGASSPARLLRRPETDTETHLRRTNGFSAQMVDRFFRPFYQGIYLAPLGEQSSRMFDFVFKMFATGGISLPARGIRAVPEQLAAALPRGSVRLGARAKAVTEGRVELADGTVLAADAVVVATEETTARKLLGARLSKEQAKPIGGRGSTCLYYALDGKPPIRDPILILNGEGNGLGDQALSPVRADGSGTGAGSKVRAQASPIKPAAGRTTKPAAGRTTKPAAAVQPAVRPVNNVVFLNSIAPSYAPAGKSLASVTVVGVPSANNARLDKAVRAQLSEWFGAEQVKRWELLRVYKIPYAQPKQTPPNRPEGFARPSAVGKGLFVAGDHRNTATLNGACESGERAAAAVLSHLGALVNRQFKDTAAAAPSTERAASATSQSTATSASPKPRARSADAAANLAAGDYLAAIAGATGAAGGSAGRARPMGGTAAATRGAVSRFREDLAAEKRRMSKLSGSITARRSLDTKSRFRLEELRRQRAPATGRTSKGLRSREELLAEADRRMALMDSMIERPSPSNPAPAAARQPAAKRAATPAPAAAPAPVPARASTPPPPPPPPPSRPAVSSSSSSSSSSGGGSRFRQEERRRG